jgi:protein-disulfide isomerase
MDSSNPNKSFLETLPPKTAFLLGIVGAILTLGTVGFVILGGCVLKGSCSIPTAQGASAPVAVAPTPTDPSAAAPAPTGAIPAVTSADWIKGDQNAPVTIVEYSDFQCPFCGAFYPTMQQVMADYQGKVRWVYRHFPLTSIHPNAEPAAEASECAGEQGKFWEFADKMFTNQDSESPAFYESTAVALGVNKAKFDACLAAKKYVSKIQAQAQGGASAGVNGTPGSYVISKNGTVQQIQGALPYASVKQMIDTALTQN